MSKPIPCLLFVLAGALSGLTFGQELIVNGRFDSGNLNGWSILQGNPMALSGGTFGVECFGSHYFFAGTSSQARLSQTVDLAGFENEIDAGGLPFRLSAALGSWIDSDVVTVTIQFQNEFSQNLGDPTNISSPDNPPLNSGSLGLLDYRNHEVATGTVPVGSRLVVVEIFSQRNSGTDNDGYIDLLSLTLDPADLDPDPLAGVEVIAHRGNSSATPENTIPSIQSAYEVGADHIEVDIRLTADGVAVLMHDATVDRTTDGTGPVSNLTLAQVKQLDAGSWFGPDFAGTKVPTLAEALVAVGQRGRILLDIKVSGMGQAIDNAIAEASTIDNRTYSTADVWLWPGPNADYGTNIIDAEYLLGTMPSPGEWQAPGFFAQQRAIGVKGWDVSSGQMTASFAAAARAEGMVASVFTINSVGAMQQFVQLGVTAMETDFPAVLAEIVVLRGDVNLDQSVNLLDVGPFVGLISQSGFQNEADMNGDGLVNLLDVDPFVAALSGN